MDYYTDGQPKHRLKTTVAGAIMTAVVNGFIVIVMGMEEAKEEAAPLSALDVPAVAEKAAV